MLRGMPTVAPALPPGPERPARGLATLWLMLLALAGAGCARRGGCTGDYCGTVVFVTTPEPDILLPPASQLVVSRDIADQIFLKLADLGMSGNTVGDTDFQPQLAERWEWANPLTLVFHLDPRARWQDGRPVTSADVAFTFDIYTDSLINSSARSALRRISAVTTRDSLTVVFRFRARYPEMFYDAVYHMRVLPSHLMGTVPREQWRSAPFGRAPVGDGPYRFVRWKAGESLELVADSTFFLGRPHIRRLIWRFTPDLQVAVTQIVAGDADAIEVLGTPDNARRARAEPRLVTYPYPGATYGFLGFNLRANGDTTEPHPLFGDRALRRALAMAVDREALLRSVFGDLAKVPPGPMPPQWWIWDSRIRDLPYDTVQAARQLTRLDWQASGGGGGGGGGGAATGSGRRAGGSSRSGSWSPPRARSAASTRGCCSSSSGGSAPTCSSTKWSSASSTSGCRRGGSTPCSIPSTPTPHRLPPSPRNGRRRASASRISCGMRTRHSTGSRSRRVTRCSATPPSACGVAPSRS